MRVGIRPLSISNTRTIAPYFLPNALTVFVAPAFPLPILVISTFFNRQIIILVDIAVSYTHLRAHET